MTPPGARPLRFEAYGVAVELVLGGPALRAAVQGILPPGAREIGTSAQAGRFALLGDETAGYEVRVGDVSWLEGVPLPVALEMLDAQLRLHVAANAREWVFVHAGVVAHAGRAIVIPGPSFSGKTTLVDALVRAGGEYGSDEYAVVGPDGALHPYTRPLRLRDAGPATGASQPGDGPDPRHPAWSATGARMGLLVLTRFRADAVWEPVRRTAGIGMLALLANTVPAQDRPQECLRALHRMAEGAVVLESERGEAEPVARALMAELGALAARRAPTPD